MIVLKEPLYFRSVAIEEEMERHSSGAGNHEGVLDSAEAKVNKKILTDIIAGNDVFYISFDSLHFKNVKGMRCKGNCENCRNYGGCRIEADETSRGMIALKIADLQDPLSPHSYSLKAAEISDHGIINVHNVSLHDFLPAVSGNELFYQKERKGHFFSNLGPDREGALDVHQYNLFVLPGLRNIIRAHEVLEKEGVYSAIERGYISPSVKESVHGSLNADILSGENYTRAMNRITSR